MTQTPNRFATWIEVAILLGISLVAFGVFRKQHNSDIAFPTAQETVTCVTPQVSSSTVVLRVDDVQAFAWPETTRRMIEDAEARGIPLTLGVIPINLDRDGDIVEYLKHHACNLEFALHGWDHSGGEDGMHPEFAILDEATAKSRIEHGLTNLALLTQDKIVTWIPPLNKQSEGTVAALTKLGFTHLSAEGTSTWDYDAATFEYMSNNLVPTEETLADCSRSMARDGKCIVMLHPQDFITDFKHDEEKYATYYLALLDALRAKGYTFARFKDMPLK
jgi:predicted deacetylase